MRNLDVGPEPSQVYSEDNLLTVRVQVDLAILLRRRGACEQALPMLRNALAAYRETFQKDDPTSLARGTSSARA